jgi:hypothetical protein
MISVFKATRQELWAALTSLKVEGGMTWKTSSREEMIAACIKADINDVPPITEESALLKKLGKTFTPEFFTMMRELEIGIKTALAHPREDEGLLLQSAEIDRQMVSVASKTVTAVIEDPTPKKKLTLKYDVNARLYLNTLVWFDTLSDNCQEFIRSRTGFVVGSQPAEYAIDLETIPAEEMLIFVGELVCFEEQYAADKAGDRPISLADTVIGDLEPDEEFNFFNSQFGSGFPLIHDGEKMYTDRYDPTHTTITELSKIYQTKRQPRFAQTNSKLLSFTIPNAGIISVPEFFRLATAIRKAQYLGATLNFTNWK